MTTPLYPGRESMATPVLYFSPISNSGNQLLNQLECQICTYNDCTGLPSLKSKCREIVRGDSCMMASPNTPLTSSTFNNKQLCIITQKGHLTTKQRSDLSIKLLRTIHVSYELLQMCYVFTLKARLAPKWNEIDKWLVKGNEIFVTGKGQGIKLDVAINSCELCLSISPIRLTLNLLKPEHLEVPTSVLLQFTNESSALIKETSISCNVCKVLPNLTPAYVYSVSHSLPPTSSGFDSYDKIRLHWKKQYGYVLPATQSLFYQIFFKFNSTNFLSYPGCCVTRGNPIAVPCRDKEEILSSFINDIHSRMPTLCNISTVLFKQKPMMPLVSLNTPHDSSDTHPNTRPVQSSCNRKKPSSHVTLGVPSLSCIEGLPPSQQVVVVVGDDPLEKRVATLLENSLQKTTTTSVQSTTVTPQHITPLQNSTANTISQHITTSEKSTLSASTIQDKSQPLVSLQQQHYNVQTLGNRSVASSLHQKRSSITTTNNTVNESSVGGQQNDGRPPPLKKRPTINNDHIVPDTGSIMDTSTTSSINDDLMYGKIEKSKVSELKSWLQSNGVRYHSKDKKDKLVQLVYQHSKMTGKYFNK